MLLTLPGGIEIHLPELPADLVAQAAFSQLTPEERHSFYVKRRFLIRQLAKGAGRTGLRSSFRWVKNKLSLGPHEAPEAPSPLVWQSVPNSLSAANKAHVEVVVTSLVENMWQNSTAIAKSSGLGMTFVGGAIWNTSLPFGGLAYGRSLSVDVGVNFDTDTGYFRVLADSQSLSRPGLSFDIGGMVDILFHVTNANLAEEDEIQAQHTKLPLIGCFRSGDNYRAWGLQAGFSVFDMIGAWMMTAGMPIEGGSLAATTRGVAMATVYSTNLERRVLKVKNLSEKTMRRLGFGKLFDLKRSLGCGPYLRQ